MSPTVVILTPDPAETRYGARIGAAFSDYARALETVGLRAGRQPWTLGPAPGAALHLPLLAWGYHRQEARWRAVLDAWPADAPLANPPALLRWNTAKTYLAELEAKGVPTIPTVFTDRANAAMVEAARVRFGGGEVVLKPQVSAGSQDTWRLAPGQTAHLDAPAMIQPFLASVAGEGELSLFLFNGALSHAVAKRATGGDFRVQPQFGAQIAAVPAPADAKEVAAAALAGCPAPPLYARVDLLRDDRGRLRLIELEVIEPDLYLQTSTTAAEAFARAVLRAAVHR